MRARISVLAVLAVLFVLSAVPAAAQSQPEWPTVAETLVPVFRAMTAPAGLKMQAWP